MDEIFDGDELIIKTPSVARAEDNTVNLYNLQSRSLAHKESTPEIIGEELVESLPHDLLARLFVACQAVCSEINTKFTVERILKESQELLRCGRCILYIYDTCSGYWSPMLKDPDGPDGELGVIRRMSEVKQMDDGSPEGEAYTTQIPVTKRRDRQENSDRDNDDISVLAVPVWDSFGNILGVLKAINKLDCIDEVCPFDKQDEVLLVHFAILAGVAMRNASILRDALASRDLADGLFKVLSSLRPDLGVQSALLELSVNAKKIMQVEHCNIYMIDRISGHLLPISNETPSVLNLNEKDCDRNPVIICAREGKTVIREYVKRHEALTSAKRLRQEPSPTDINGGRNQPPAVSFSLLSPEYGRTDSVEHTTLAFGFPKRSCSGEILAKDCHQKQNVVVVPLKAENQMTIGLIELQNKQDNDGRTVPFTDDDVRILEMFGRLVGPRLTQSDLGMKAIATPLTEAGRAADNLCLERRRPSIAGLSIQEEAEEMDGDSEEE